MTKKDLSKKQKTLQLTWTSSPASGTVLVPADVSGFVGIVAAVVIEVAAPQDGNAFAVVARKFGFRIAGSVV